MSAYPLSTGLHLQAYIFNRKVKAVIVRASPRTNRYAGIVAPTDC